MRPARCVFRKRLTRAKLLAFFAAQPPCVVAMEACAGAHYWAREIAKLGHTVRLIPPAYVKPFVKRQKNDAADAEAICEAAQRPTMRFVPVKSRGAAGERRRVPRARSSGAPAHPVHQRPARAPGRVRLRRSPKGVSHVATADRARRGSERHLCPRVPGPSCRC